MQFIISFDFTPKLILKALNETRPLNNRVLLKLTDIYCKKVVVNFKEKELIIFDLDETLINSISHLTLAVNKVLLHYNSAPLTIKEVIPFFGNGAEPLAKRALGHAMPDQKVSTELLEDAVVIYFSAYQEVICNGTYTYPGALETLNELI